MSICAHLEMCVHGYVYAQDEHVEGKHPLVDKNSFTVRGLENGVPTAFGSG